MLGGQAGSQKMRDRACQELHGYNPSDTVPDYRHVPAAVMVLITNRAARNGVTQRIDDSVFPTQVREMIREKVDLEDAIPVRGSANWRRWPATPRTSFASFRAGRVSSRTR